MTAPLNRTTSPGGKVIWSCPNCGENVVKEMWYGTVSYVCNSCNRFGPWKERVCRSKQKEKSC